MFFLILSEKLYINPQNIKNYLFVFFKNFYTKLKKSLFLDFVVINSLIKNLFFKRKGKKIRYYVKKEKKIKNFLNFSFFFFFKKNYFFFLFKNIIFNFKFNVFCKNFFFFFKKTFQEGFLYIRGLLIIFFIDASFTDDEPLWEPIEWSLVQTWLLFIFIISWIAENLITSRFGSYTGRDKRVWLAWYKTFWLIEIWYAISYGAACMFVIVPFYYELTYSVSFVFSWWNWCNRVFFFNFISIYSVILFLALIFNLSLKWLNWKKQFFIVLLINFFLLYLIYSQFIITFFSYFTDPVWYQKTRIIDYIQLSHEPLKWGWGPAKRDHFSYHKTSTVFWFKNDGPFAGAFLMINMFFFLTLFFTFFYWLILLRRIYTTNEATFTFSTFCVSALKQFFFCFFFLYILVLISFIICYWRFPIEFFWIINSNSWFVHFFFCFKDYFFFLLNL